MEIGLTTLKICKEKFLSLEELVYLYSLVTANGWEVDMPISSLAKLQTLGYIDRSMIPTEEASLLLAEAVKNEPKLKMSYPDHFNAFWKAFPLKNDERELRTNKPQAYKEYSQVLASGYTPQHLLSRLEQDVENKSASKEGLRFMRGIVNWLRLETFNEVEEPVIESHGKKIL